jgi:hypothetical protein
MSKKENTTLIEDLTDRVIELGGNLNKIFTKPTTEYTEMEMIETLYEAIDELYDKKKK